MRIGILRTLCTMMFCGCFGMSMLSQAYGESNMSGRPPLAQEFGVNAGIYDLVVLVSQPIVDPGDTHDVEIYVSGYGAIRAGKVAFYPSPGVFDASRSTATPLNNKPTRLDKLGMVVTLDPKSFCDVNGYRILTEGKPDRETPPIALDLSVNDDAKPGPHSIQFVLTYFDGQTWKTASKNVDFTIRNVYQRYEWWIARIGVLAAVATIGPMLRWPWLLWRRLRPTPAASAAAIPSPARQGTISKDRKQSPAK